MGEKEQKKEKLDWEHRNEQAGEKLLGELN